MPGESVFPLHHDTGKAIRCDLEAAGIPYETEEGAADFHALRVYYVSALVRSGRSIKEVQQLARHSKPETTLRHYAKVSVHDLYGAVESFSVPEKPQDGESARMFVAVTGTDGAIHKRTLAHDLPTDTDGSVRLHAATGVIEGSHSQASMGEETLEIKAPAASVRFGAGVDADMGEEAPPGFEPGNNGFADRRLTTWLRSQHVESYQPNRKRRNPGRNRSAC